MGGGQTRAWRAFTNEVVTPGSPASNSRWVCSARGATPWIQMTYPSAIVITSFNIFIRNGGKNITSWNVQGRYNPGGSEFTTLMASTVGTAMQLNANSYYSFNFEISTAYKVYRINILAQSGGTSGSDVGISLLQFNTSNITANGYTPMAANLNMGQHKVTNVQDPSSGSDAATRGFVEIYKGTR
jgi:hypothetical protein